MPSQSLSASLAVQEFNEPLSLHTAGVPSFNSAVAIVSGEDVPPEPAATWKSSTARVPLPVMCEVQKTEMVTSPD